MSGETDQARWRGVRPVAGIQGVWPAIGAVRIQKHGHQTAVGTHLFYTVPDGKKLFISSSLLASKLNVGAEVRCYAYVRDTGDVTQYVLGDNLFTQAGQLSTHSNFFPALEIPAGYDLCLNCSGVNQEARCTVDGWLEDA